MKKTSKVTRVEQAPDWLLVIRKFLRIVNHRISQQTARNFLKEIQTKFAASKKKKTPYIDLIRHIQDALVKSVNNNLDKKVITLKAPKMLITLLKQASATVVISSKSPKKEKTKTLAGTEKKKPESKQDKDKKNMKKTNSLSGLGLVPATELKKMKFKSLPFTGQWEKLIGKPSVPFQVMIYGTGGSGKSTLSVQFAHYLADKHNMKVLYIAKEEGISQTIQDKFRRLNAFHPNIYLSDGSKLFDVLQNFDVAVFDSVNELNLLPNDIRAIIARFPKLSTVQIFKATKDGKFLGQNDFQHLVQAQFKCENGMCYAEKNRFGGNGTIKINFK
jgi:DNA replication protein DnaC